MYTNVGVHQLRDGRPGDGPRRLVPRDGRPLEPRNN